MSRANETEVEERECAQKTQNRDPRSVDGRTARKVWRKINKKKIAPKVSIWGPRQEALARENALTQPFDGEFGDRDSRGNKRKWRGRHCEELPGCGVS